MGAKYKKVFEPINIRGVEFKNRIEMAPPSPNLAGSDGKVTTEFINWFRPAAMGGAAIISVGNCMIDIKEACDEERQLDLGTDECCLPLSQFAEMCDGFGAHASLEINHNGKDSQFERTGKIPYTPSPIITSRELMRAKQAGREPVPTIEMTHEKIADTVEKYAMAAYRCKKAGFQIAMIHGGHGNLISQFVSPLYNKRNDEYGGSLENRARFAVEVLDNVRRKCGEDFVIEYRISADEIHPDGMHFEETLQFIEIIQNKIDIIHVSAGLHSEIEYMRNWYQNYMVPRKLNVHYAHEIKKVFPNLLVNTVGSIMNIGNAEEILEAKMADFVSFCRPLIADPEMPRKYAAGHEEDHRPCIRCQWCGSRLLIPAVIGCAVNPMCANTTEFPNGIVPKAEKKKKVGVVGGGPAGIQAMITLVERGHDVTLYEKTGELGGNVIAAAAQPLKEDMRDYLKYLQVQTKKAPARILINTEATKDILDREQYDALIIAVGAEPMIPNIPGIDKAHVHWAADADLGKVQIGKKTVIIGAGAVGIECAIHLKSKGSDVEIIEMASDLSALRSMSGGVMLELLRYIDKHKIPVRLCHKLEEVTDKAVICSDTRRSGRVEISADTVLLAVGMKARYEAVSELRHCAPETEVFVVGDARKPGSIATAVNSAFKAAAHI